MKFQLKSMNFHSRKCILECGLSLNVLIHADICLTLKQLQMHEFVLSTEAVASQVLKHQAISNLSAVEIFIVLDQFDTKILHFIETWNYILKTWPSF